MKSNRLLRRVLFALIIVLLGLAVVIYPRYQHLFGEQSMQTVLHMSCEDLQQGCQFTVDGQQFQLKTKQAIGGAAPFELLFHGKANQVRANWSMQGMDMGPNEYRFVKKGDVSWTATMALPFCTAARKDWILNLSIDKVNVQITTVAQRN
ncbi:hypothetical protein NT239_14475 [Chitinibacter sp. SCUT-21]|uniref:hypothetical protein n=1 Tax=Chitinibacter sp. SCUT-21 TaxID=2970891 RepID=UPI0035A58270